MQLPVILKLSGAGCLLNLSRGLDTIKDFEVLGGLMPNIYCQVGLRLLK